MAEAGRSLAAARHPSATIRRVGHSGGGAGATPGARLPLVHSARARAGGYPSGSTSEVGQPLDRVDVGEVLR